jgi:hypothetical protein
MVMTLPNPTVRALVAKARQHGHLLDREATSLSVQLAALMVAERTDGIQPPDIRRVLERTGAIREELFVIESLMRRVGQ